MCHLSIVSSVLVSKDLSILLSQANVSQVISQLSPASFIFIAEELVGNAARFAWASTCSLASTPKHCYQRVFLIGARLFLITGSEARHRYGCRIICRLLEYLPSEAGGMSPRNN